MAHATGRELFVQDTFGGADAKYRLPVRIINELAWHSLFARTMLISDPERRLRTIRSSRSSTFLVFRPIRSAMARVHPHLFWWI